MIFLEQTVNQILQEEGQVIISLEDLQISWEDIESLFIGTYEQSKQYISIYDWVNQTIDSQGHKQNDWAHIRHLTLNAYNNMQRFLPDLPGQYWEFNPYTKDAKSLINTNFSLEVGKYPTLENLDYTLPLTFKKGKKVTFRLPCTFDLQSFSLLDLKATKVEHEHGCNKNEIVLKGKKGSGSFNEKTLIGNITLNEDISTNLSITSKYVGIKELDLTCELFYTWFKGNLLTLIGSMKRQIDLQGVGLPFDINQDDLLNRGRELMNKVEELKGTKSHWSNF